MKTGFTGTHYSALGTIKSVRRISGKNHTYRGVCAKCNNGWMSELENKFRNIVKSKPPHDLIKVINRRDRTTISRWITKTAIIAHFSSNYRKILPLSIARTMFETGNNLKGVKVFVGLVKPARRIVWLQTSPYSCTIRKSDQNNIDFFNDVFVFLLSIDSLMLCFTWKDNNLTDYELVCHNNLFGEIYPKYKPPRTVKVFNNLIDASQFIRLELKSNL